MTSLYISEYYKYMQTQNNKNTLSSTHSYENFTSIIDPRTPQQVLQQSKEAEQIYQNNMKIFNIKLTSKKKVSYTPSKLFKVSFSNGWYVNITDNSKVSDNVFITVHGAPGDHREWAGLEKEMEGTCRWINVVIPGFDNEDERRGNYSGSVEDFSQLLILLIHELKISKFIYVGHSLGSILAGYFINHYPEYVKGYINITGIVNLWYVGLMTFYRVTVAKYGFGVSPNRNALFRLLKKDQYRQKLNSIFLQETKDVAFGPVPFPRLTITQMVAYIKIIGSLQRGCSDFFAYNKKLTILRVLIYGKKDPLHEHHKSHEAIYSISRGSLNFASHKKNAKLIKSMKQELEETIDEIYGIKIQAEKIQEYFCYHMDDTGHNAHKRRPVQLSRIFKVYMTTLNVMEKYKTLIETRL